MIVCIVITIYSMMELLAVILPAVILPAVLVILIIINLMMIHITINLKNNKEVINGY